MALQRLPGEALVGVGLAVLGGAMFWATSQLNISSAYAKVGPAAIPYLVAAGIVICGVTIAWTRRNAIDVTSPSDIVAVVAISAGIVCFALVLRLLGFILSEAVLFFLVAWGFGVRRHLLNATIAVLLGIAVFVLFNYGLGLLLPRGPLEALLP
jgi:putative tricarboxylic transport membrane protein